ncbi:T9SS type A sorting domain-containing protein [candidate division KSB1 bacterium]|nr:T9SS type A sorting domain-containing protein [candidate division KSB1 bacterium]
MIPFHNIKTVFIFILLMITSSNLYSKQIFMSPDGNDSNTGTAPDSPLANLNAAFNIAEPGDEIRLLPGRYFEKTSLILRKNGEFDNPITIMSHSTDTASFAIIDGGAEPRTYGSGMIIKYCSWLTFKNLKFQNCWQDVIEIEHSSYISFTGCHFQGGRRVIYPQYEDCHHFLIDGCFWQQDARIYTELDWDEMHHGSLSYLNGSLFGSEQIAGGVVIRNNVIKDAFNGIRFTGDKNDRRQNANFEIYGNFIMNTGDNAFEPEDVCYNLHFYHNRLENSHAFISVDMIRGGDIYFYGNRGWQSVNAGHEWTVFKFRGYEDGGSEPLDEPFYVFNNSWYVHFDAVSGSGSEYRNRYMKHFNNAYYFTEGSGLLGVNRVGDENEFDYDCSNTEYPYLVEYLGFEENGIEADPLFVDPAAGNFQLSPESPCIDSGKVMQFSEFDWEQDYEGAAPNIGAFENGRLVEGPPFRFREPPGGAYYTENPRIVRHQIDQNQLLFHFSAELDPASVTTDAIHLFQDSLEIEVQDVSFPENEYEMLITANRVLRADEISLRMDPLPVGRNGESATHWASTIPEYEKPTGTAVKLASNSVESDKLKLEIYPNPFNSSAIIRCNFSSEYEKEHALLHIYNIRGRLMKKINSKSLSNGFAGHLNSADFSSGIYIAVLRAGKKKALVKFSVIK